MKATSFDGCICLPLTRKWSEVKPKTAIVLESYETVYKNPMQLKSGDKVKIEKRETNPDWLGWVFCVDERGVAGWVSEKYLNDAVELGQTAMAIKEYDATELTASVGEELKIYYEEFGWCWSSNRNGIKGWIPTKNIRINS
jgi:hypothetical protein